MINTEILRDLEDAIGEKAATRILSVFLVELEDQLAEILVCMEAIQTTRIAEIAHSLKSTSATFGATDLNDLAFQIEMAAGENRVGDLVALVGELQNCIQITRSLYRSYTD